MKKDEVATRNEEVDTGLITKTKKRIGQVTNQEIAGIINVNEQAFLNVNTLGDQDEYMWHTVIIFYMGQLLECKQLTYKNIMGRQQTGLYLRYDKPSP